MKKAFSNNIYRNMLEMSIDLSLLHDMREVLNLIMNKAVELLDADRSTLYLFNENDNQLISEFVIGEKIEPIKLPLDSSSISGHCGIHKKIVNVKDVYNHRALNKRGLTFNAHFDKINRYKTKSILSVPLNDSDGNLLGVLELINKNSAKGFSKNDENLITLFARQCSITVSRLKIQQLATIFPEDERKKWSGRREVFVVFFDIVNYTLLSEMLGDTTIQSIIKIWEKDHILLICEFGGTYIKTVGDGIISIFGIQTILPPRKKPFKQQKKTNKKQQNEFHDFKNRKSQFANLENLKEFIQDFHSWAIQNRTEFDSALDRYVRHFLSQLQAENVVRFMFLAQKKLDWLNKSFIEKDLIGGSFTERIFMKGGSEFGSAIVDFDMYGRIDVIGDTVNIASRISAEGNRLTANTITDEHPILTGKHFRKFLTDDFIYMTENITRLKGKEEIQHLYILDGIASFDNRANIPAESFSKLKTHVLKQIKIMNNIKQGALPFNFANYTIEQKDKYKTDHSKRVAAISLYIADLMNRDLKEKISLEKKRNIIKKYEILMISDKKRNNIARAALLHDLGTQCLSEKVKGYVDPSKCVNSITQEEREMYANITSSFGAYILSGIEQLKDLALTVKSFDLHFNGNYKSKIPGIILKGKDIPIESRIIALANSIDSILSDQPFRKGLGKSVLCQILLADLKTDFKDEKIKKFDPYLISLILKFYQYEFPKNLIMV
ncbi:MAG: GAF domain-containing protein [Candidatus Anammoxibacter sp.]